MKISCKFGEPSCCRFPLRALTLKIYLRGGVANAKPKYPPDASGGYNNKLPQFTSPVPDQETWAVDGLSLSFEGLNLK